MKKFFIGFIVGAMMFSSIGYAVTYVAQPATFKIFVNGEEFNSNPPALAVDGSTYLPLRAMGDALGVPVEWNQELRQVEVGIMPGEYQYMAENDVISNDKWKMTFLKCKTFRELDRYTKASDGKEFVVAIFELENITNEQQVFSPFFLSTYFDNYRTRLSILADDIDGAIPMMGGATIEPGKKIKGYLPYEVELGWDKMDIIYEDIVDETNTIKFTITK